MRCGSGCSRSSRRNTPAIEATHYYIDALAMYMVLDPAQFEVIVTNNLFGDIITDLGAALQGGLGLAASGNLHPGKTSMFEPVHGSAPKFAGKNVANPIGRDLVGGPDARDARLDEPKRARIEAAVRGRHEAGECTQDDRRIARHARGGRGNRGAVALSRVRDPELEGQEVRLDPVRDLGRDIVRPRISETRTIHGHR